MDEWYFEIQYLGNTNNQVFFNGFRTGITFVTLLPYQSKQLVHLMC